MTYHVRKFCLYASAMVLALMFVSMVSAAPTVVTGTANVTSPAEGEYKSGTFSIAGDLGISFTKTQKDTAEWYDVKVEVFVDGGAPIITQQTSILFDKDEVGNKMQVWNDMYVNWGTTIADNGKHTATARVSYRPLNGQWTTVASDTKTFFVANLPPPHPHFPLGGSYIPVNKFGLLAPYIGLASTTVIGTVTTVVYVKRVKHKKEKQ